MDPVIQLRALCVQRDGKRVLDGLDLSLSPGERLAVVGTNGAGKTTLLRTVVGLESPLSGDVVLFGQTCRQEPDFKQQRMRIGLLFQDSDDQLFCPSVIEDVAFGPCNMGMDDTKARARANEALETLGIAHLAPRFAHRLSGGEKRLVCLAGLLAMRPDVLLLDEPTNGVDEQNGLRLQAALQDYTGAIVLVSHDPRFVMEIATRVMALSAGRLQQAEVHEHLHFHRHPHIHV